MTNNTLKYINKYNKCTYQDKKNLYKQKINKYFQSGGAYDFLPKEIPEEILKTKIPI